MLRKIKLMVDTQDGTEISIPNKFLFEYHDYYESHHLFARRDVEHLHVHVNMCVYIGNHAEFSSGKRRSYIHKDPTSMNDSYNSASR